jgi:Tfp pilus assembly protein PilN
MDLNKEIKLSDLLRRKKGPVEEDVAPEKKPEKERKPRSSFSFSRAKKEPKAPKEPKAASAVSPKSAPPPPAVPLMRAFDLMPKESEREKTAASPAFLKIVLALVAILVLAGLAGAYVLMGARAEERQATADDLRAQLAELSAQATPDEEPSVATLTAEGQARTAALSDALAARVAWDRILREFSLVLPEEVWLTTLSSSSAIAAAPGAAVAEGTGEGTFTINGFATSQEEVARLLSRLEVIPEFASVQLQSSSRGADAGAEGGASTSGDSQDFSFAIVATIAPNGVPAQ